jgi:carnitine 3-dehydrogenase
MAVSSAAPGTQLCLGEILNMTQADTVSKPTRLIESTVLPAWIDYNGHMTEFRYAQVFSDSCEVLLRKLGLHDDYVTAGHSYYTAETHSRF